MGHESRLAQNARVAASAGDESRLRELHELGGEAAASLAAANGIGYTPAHWAARHGQEGFLRALHELGSETAASLAAADARDDPPAHQAAALSLIHI